MGLCGAFLVGVSGYVVVRDPTRSYVKPRGRTPSALCCLMTSESFGCHDISRHRLGASARWESCCFDLSEVVSRSLWWLPASPGCTARGWGATGGGLGVLVVGGAFVQYAQPLASGSRPSWSRATRGPSRASSGRSRRPTMTTRTLRRWRAGSGGGEPVTGSPGSPRTLAPARPGVHSTDISAPDIGAPSEDR